MQQMKQSSFGKRVQRIQDILDLGESFLRYGRMRTQRTAKGAVVTVLEATISDEARLRWLLGVCQKKRPEVDSKLIQVFICADRDDQPRVGWEWRKSNSVKAARIESALNEIRAGITSYIAGRGWLRSRSESMRLRLNRDEHDQTWLTYKAPIDEAFVASAFDLVVREGDRIRRCARMKCESKRLFVPHRRQQYCSKRCSILERTRRYRENPANQASQSDRRHDQYVKQKAKELGLSHESMKKRIKRRTRVVA